MHHGMIYYPVTNDTGFAITGPHVVAGLVLAKEEQETIPFLGEQVKLKDPKGRISYTLDFSARIVDTRLILRTEHNIRLDPSSSTWWRRGPFHLPLFEIHRLPIQICRHHNVKPPTRPWDIAKSCSPLFPFAIMDATPKREFWGWMTETQRDIILKYATRHWRPWITEMNQVERSRKQTGETFVWGCVECSTKWTIEWVDRGLKILVWKNLGNDTSLRTAWRAHVGVPNMARSHCWMEFRTGEETYVAEHATSLTKEKAATCENLDRV